MSGKVTGRRRSSIKEKGSIKNFFGKKEASDDISDAGDKEVSSVRSSPDKTSDYESETSRSNTPTVSSVGSSPTQEVSKDETSVAVKREVKTEEEDEEGQGADMFNATADAEDLDDKAGVSAAIMSGLLSADVKDEEERMKAETLRMERQKEVKRKQEMAKEAEELSVKQRYERLQKLLGKSQFYTDFLLKKMKGHEAAMELKKQTNEARAKKRAEKGENALTDKRRTGRNEEKEEVEEKSTAKRGRKSKGGEEPANKKRKTEDVVDQKKARLEKVEGDRKFEGKTIPDNQPLLLTGGIMRNYQLEGYEWMSTLWENGINGILADEMGLGKTIQVISLFCHMYEMGVSGPFLVVGPLSTVPNWYNEFKRFAPKVPCLLYHGNQQERMEMRSKLTEKHRADEVDVDMLHVVVTSYEIAMNDRAAFSNIMWRYIVVDEGHRLKNMNCRLIKELKQYHSANRLLLTGTPLQNNLSELWSLLNFLLPEIFDDLRVFESWFDAKEMDVNVDEEKRIDAQEQQNSILSTLHQILTPFLLRRIKADVDLDIPPKKEVLVYCPMTETQREMYTAVVNKMIDSLMAPKEEEVQLKEDKNGRSIRDKKAVDYSMFLSDKEFANDDKFEEYVAQMEEYRESLSNKSNECNAYYSNIEKQGRGVEQNYSVKSRMMDMRKTVNHPYLIEYPLTEDGGFYRSDEDMVTICGKLRVLDQLLTDLNSRGHKTLIFSQMTKMLDIIGDYLNLRKLKFSRLDGSMNWIDRQANIDSFNTDTDVKVFLLSTRAGGLGINLTSADTCIIYDSDWNPQQDLQAQDRCHRIGRTKPVMVYRLVTKKTIDQVMVERAQAKRALERLVVHKDKFKSGAKNLKNTVEGIKTTEIMRVLLSEDGLDTCDAEDTQRGLEQHQLDKIMDRTNMEG